MATCEGVTALVTLMLAIWSKIRVLESKFVTKGGPAWSRVRVGMSEALGGWSVVGGWWWVGGEEDLRARKELEQMVIR